MGSRAGSEAAPALSLLVFTTTLAAGFWAPSGHRSPSHGSLCFKCWLEGVSSSRSLRPGSPGSAGVGVGVWGGNSGPPLLGSLLQVLPGKRLLRSRNKVKRA